MRKLIVWLPLVLLMCQSAQAQDGRGAQFEAIGFSYGNTTVGYSIFEGDLAGTPSWNPEEGDPPLALSRALEIARNNLPRFVQEADKLAVGKVNLERFNADKWVYHVLFNCGDGAGDCGPSFWILVRMDGSVVEPEFSTAASAPKKSEGGP